MSNEPRYNPKMVKLLKKLQTEPSEATFENADAFTAYLVDLESETEPEPKLPTYADKGRILFWFDPYAESNQQYEIIDWDGDSSVMWLNEGVGCDYALKEFFYLDIELAGVYVLEDVYGVYHRGSSWGDDDDEDWYCGYLRRASPEEIEGEALNDEAS